MIKLTKVTLRNVEQGNETFVPEDDGYYLLCGPSILSCLALTYGGSGALTLYDAEVMEIDGKYYFDERTSHPVFMSHPVQVGFYSCNAGVTKNLVAVLTGGECGIIPMANIYYKPLSKGK